MTDFNSHTGPPLSPEERDLEAALASLLPADASEHRDSLMFEAGRRSIKHRLWLWRSATGLAAALAVVALLNRPTETPLPQGQLVHDAPTPAQPVPPASQPGRDSLLAAHATPPLNLLPLHPPDSYLGLRQALLRRDGQLPPSFAPVSTPAPFSRIQRDNQFESGLFGRGTFNRGDRL